MPQNDNEPGSVAAVIAKALERITELEERMVVVEATIEETRVRIENEILLVISRVNGKDNI